ncbi:MAG: M20/M25/M40 family metallo-hydrolase [Nocardioides sp.]|uniref:M20/M25/M40 family metallo-hydrolase n=1 Tax=Nocardioides sp. TaxID=35761 RepID=UPI003F012F29
MSSAAHPERVVRALQALVQLPTVSYYDAERIDSAVFDALVAELETQFPLLHANLERHRIGAHGLLFHWRGAASDKPVVLMAHTDVVPVDPDSTWQHEAFSGAIADGYLWGRGTLDDKCCVVGICEAVERVLEADQMPAQDVWLSFGADEEVMGSNAREAVDFLRGRGVRPWLVLDEGGAIAGGAFPGVEAPLGVVGVTEKGVSAIELVAEGRGGHASMPSPDGPTYRLARAITRLDKAPMPAKVPAPTLELMRRLAPHLPAALRPLVSNVDHLKPLVARILVAAGSEAGAMARTTIATTTLSGSPANNVIASTAKAGLNVRIQVGDTLAGVVDHIRRVVRDDSIRIDVVDAGEPSPVSPMGDAFELVESSIRAVYPEAVPTPYALMGATDSRHFTAITDNVYRFAPFRMSKSQREAIHSFDERIGVDDLVDGATWYQHLIERLPR